MKTNDVSFCFIYIYSFVNMLLHKRIHQLGNFSNHYICYIFSNKFSRYRLDRHHHLVLVPLLHILPHYQRILHPFPPPLPQPLTFLLVQLMTLHLLQTLLAQQLRVDCHRLRVEHLKIKTCDYIIELKNYEIHEMVNI